MEIKVESKITVKVGDVSMELDRNSAYKLYNSLKAELGIVDNTWTYPTYPYTTPWTNDGTADPCAPNEPYTTSNTSKSSSVNELVSDITEFNKFSDADANNFLEGLNGFTTFKPKIHEEEKEIEEFHDAVRQYNKDTFV